MIRIAISSSEALKSESIHLLEGLGIRFPQIMDSTLVSSSNFPVEILFVPEEDMGTLTENGLVDLAIVGEHIINEQPTEVETLRKLNIGRCRLVLVAPIDLKRVPENLIGHTIVSSLPNTLQKHLKARGSRTKVHRSSAGLQLTQSGVSDLFFAPIRPDTNLSKYGLRVLEKIGESEAILIANKNLSLANSTIVEELLFRLDTALETARKKLITMHVPNEKCEAILELLPSLQKPTIIPIDEQTSLVQSVMDEIRFWDIVEKLRELKAQNIVLSSIDNIIH